ncbi:TOMM precursor leader peptide-binding protein [uncultured Paludibaculum sp.]|uniref:TOMM precursor leader peptide-binding protein n=1 Tax=uncultured Paludibaculum sp. TaxID=1765020 RepID=UPI002AAB7DFF|nr:TOMM precursor leader peptide-binding protein [uncultured Paludibaculum sp.]
MENPRPPSHSRRTILLPNGQPISIAEDGAYFDDAATPLPPAEQPNPFAAYQELAGARLAPAGIELIPIAAATDFLELVLGQQHVTCAAGAGLRVVVTDDYLRPEVAASVAAHPRCLLAKPVGKTLWLGPFFHESSHVCYACLHWWLTLNRYPQNSTLLANAPYAPDHSVAQTPSTEVMAAGWIATSATLLAAGLTIPDLTDGILHFDTVTQRITRSAVVPNGSCPHCAPHTSPAPLASLEGRYTGIVRQQASGSLLGAHVAIGRCLLSYPRHPHIGVIEPQQVGGKGTTPEEARNSLVGEALERYSLVYQGTEPLVRAAGCDIDAIPLNHLLCCASDQTTGLPEADDERPGLYDEHVPRLWAEVRPLAGGPTLYAPADYCYFWPLTLGDGPVCIADSNGCACGPDQASALLSGLLELIERDAVAIWWYNRIPRPALQVESVSDPHLRRMVAQARREGWSASILDITTEFGVSVYVASLRHQQDGRVALGSAADPDPAVAAAKALAEAALVEFWAMRPGPTSSLSRWLASITPERYPQAVPNGEIPLPPPPPDQSTAGHLDRCLRRLQSAGIAAYYLDLTRPETSWPVVRVLAPGLRPLAPHFGPGRLFDAPVRLGWREQPLRREDLEVTPFRL